MSKLIKTLMLAAALAPAFAAKADITFENDNFKFILGDDAKAKSLVIKKTGEEMLAKDENVSFFAITQARPFNNEIKLEYPNKRTTYPAKSVRREGDKLIVAFELIRYEAQVSVEKGDGFLAFTLDKFIVDRDTQFEGLRMDLPPAKEFRVIQLPVKERKNFGIWLNTMHDEKAALAVIGTSSWPRVDAEKRNGCRVMYVDALEDVKREGVGGAIVAGSCGESLLDAIDEVEKHFDLPRGVKSRRSGMLNRSIAWTIDITPANVDEHIEVAKKCGLSMLLIYYPAFSGFMKGYETLGDYEFNRSYPNGLEDLKKVVQKIRDAGITPGFHTLQTHIGSMSNYVTPVADPRLNLKRHYTLAKPYPADDPTTIEVLENPLGSPMYSKARVLKFGGELFHYESFTTEPPYKFTGVKRGYWRTAPQTHVRGEIGGILDVCEYGAISCYIDQRTDLQDEVADKIAEIYNVGFDFCYFDGSEGANQPYEIYVPLSQYRVCRKFKKMPIFTEGAAKAHFSWHLQAGANAFDAFHPEIFKPMIAKFPLAEAPNMRRDFTRLDFGWWHITMPGFKSRKTPEGSIGTQPDMIEYGTSKAASWDCPATLMIRFPEVRSYARFGDVAEIMRRWELVRSKNMMTDEWRAKLRDPSREFHLFNNGNDNFELVEWKQILIGGAEYAHGLRAFAFERGGKCVVAYWHTSGEGKYELADESKTVIEAGNLKYFTSDKTRAEVEKAFKSSRVISERRGF